MNTRLTNDKHLSLNESIAYVNSPQRELDEAREYALALEGVLLALCEELNIDPDALVEDIQTYDREMDMKLKRRRLSDKAHNATVRHSESRLGKYGGRLTSQGPTKSEPVKRKKMNAAHSALRAHDRLDSKEKSSSKLYGKGGKVVAHNRGSVKVVS